MTATATILGLFTGEPEQRWEGKEPSAIRKTRADGAVAVTPTGLSGDRQADRSVHGGPEMALHHYPTEHYAHWQVEFPENAEKYRAGGFGENICSEGFTEENLCIGDIFSSGSVRLQISQGRQPCWKLNMHTENPGQAAAFQKSGRTGWYYRVLAEGNLQAGDQLVLTERPCPQWNLREVILARFDPRLNPAVAKALSDLPELTQSWRAAFARKAEPGNPD